MGFLNDCWLSVNKLYGYDCSSSDGVLSVDKVGICVSTVVWSIVWSLAILEVVGLSWSGFSLALTTLFLRLGAVLSATMGLLGRMFLVFAYDSFYPLDLIIVGLCMCSE